MRIPPELRSPRHSPLRLWIPLVVILGLIGLGSATAIPTGPYRYETGRVTDFVLLPRKGPVRHVVITLDDGRQIQRRMGLAEDCRVGDLIALEHHERLLIGDRYSIVRPFACKRPPLP